MFATSDPATFIAQTRAFLGSFEQMLAADAFAEQSAAYFRFLRHHLGACAAHIGLVTSAADAALIALSAEQRTELDGMRRRVDTIIDALSWAEPDERVQLAH